MAATLLRAVVAPRTDATDDDDDDDDDAARGERARRGARDTHTHTHTHAHAHARTHAPHAGGEEDGVLRNEAELLAQVEQAERAHVDAVDRDRALVELAATI